MSLSHTPYLIRHPQSSHFWFRRRVPQHLRPALGRTEIRVSLQTPIPHDAVQRCRLTANIVDKLFAEAEARNERIGDELAAQLQTLRSEFGDPDSITAPLERWMIPTLLTRYQEALLAGHELQCQAMLPNELSPADSADPEKRAEHQKAEDEAYAAIEAESTELQEQLKQLERARTFKRLSVIDDSAAAHLYAERLSPLTTTADVLEDYKFELLRKEIEVVRLLIERLNGAEIPAPPLQTASPTQVDSWEVMLKTWKQERLPRPKSYDEAVSIVGQWQAVYAELAPSTITREHVENWVKQLKARNLNFQTVKKKVAVLRAVFGAAIYEKVIATDVNPFALVQLF